MRILTLVHEAPPVGGGGGRTALELCQQIASFGHQVDVVTMAYRGLPSQEVINGVTIYRVPCIRRKAEISYTDEKISFVLRALPLVKQLHRRNPYDLTHCHFIIPAGLIAYLLRRSLRVPYVITTHGSDVPGYNPDYFALEHRLMAPLWRAIVGHSAHLIPPSNALADLIRATKAPRLPRISTVPYGFPAHRFNTSQRERKILLISRMLPRKGFQYFLEAIKGLALDWEVNIVGDGPMRAELETMAQGLQTPVRFWGWIDNASDEVRRLYETSSIFVFPSLFENFPVSLLEAMSAGLAIITTNISGCPEVVGDTGVLVPPADSGAIRTALLELIEDPARTARLGDAARKRLEDNFDWPKVVQRTLDIYNTAIGASRP